jgi:hypothetical protein
VTEIDARARRVERLRHELSDERIWVDQDEALTSLLVTELDHARHPHSHEGVPARYGAIILASEPTVGTTAKAGGDMIGIDHADLDVVRLLADGRSSFLVRTVGGPDRLVCFERTREYESSAVHLATAHDALIVQRLARGWVRLCSPTRVAVWDGIQWSAKAVSSRLVETITAELDEHDPVLLANILELSTHWLGGGRIGATIVWHPNGDAHELGHLGFAMSVAIPPLDMSNRQHFAAMLNALSQFDRAALVDGKGCVTTVGVHLWTTPDVQRLIPAYRGTRHTSAQRFSAEAPDAVVFVVSSSGTLTVFRAGRRIDSHWAA